METTLFQVRNIRVLFLIKLVSLLFPLPANFLFFVITGTVKAIEVLEAKAKPEFKARMTVRLAVAGAFHTQYMNSAVETLSEVLSQTEIKAPRIPVYSNVDAKPHSDPEVIKSILAMQVTSPVQWETTLGGLLKGKREQGMLPLQQQLCPVLSRRNVPLV